MMQGDEVTSGLDVFSAKDLVTDVCVEVLDHIGPLGIPSYSSDEHEDGDSLRYWLYLPDPVSESTHAVIFDVDIRVQSIAYTVVAPTGIGLSETLPPVDGAYGKGWVAKAVSSITSILDGNIESEMHPALAGRGPNLAWLFSELLCLKLNDHFGKSHGFMVYMERPGRLDSYASVSVVHHDGPSTGKATAYLNHRGNAVDVFIAPDAVHVDGDTYVVDFDGIPVDRLAGVAYDMAKLLEARAKALSGVDDGVGSVFERLLEDYGVYGKTGE